MSALGVQFDSRGHKKQREPPDLCDGRPNPERLRILVSGDDSSLCGYEEAQIRSVCWFTSCWMSNFFSSVNARFGSVPSVFWRNFHHFSSFMVTWLAVSSWRCSILKGFTSRSSLNTWCMVDLLTPAAVAKVPHLMQGFRRSFSLVFFEELRATDTPFSSAGLDGQGCFRSPGTSYRSSTPFNGSYLTVLQSQHYFFHLCDP